MQKVVEKLTGGEPLSIDQLIEYRCAPLPMARVHVSGLAVYERSILVSLSLSTSARRASAMGSRASNRTPFAAAKEF